MIGRVLLRVKHNMLLLLQLYRCWPFYRCTYISLTLVWDYKVISFLQYMTSTQYNLQSMHTLSHICSTVNQETFSEVRTNVFCDLICLFKSPQDLPHSTQGEPSLRSHKKIGKNWRGEIITQFWKQSHFTHTMQIRVRFI